MLVLSRKNTESIMIGEQIELKVLSIDGDQVKLGIIAPDSVKIYRTELYETIQKQNREAVQQDVETVKNILNINKKD